VALKTKILASGLSVSELVSAAWASALDLPRLRQARVAPTARASVLAPQKDWEVNQPAQLATVLQKLEAIQRAFNASQSGRKESFACRPDRPRRLRQRSKRPRRTQAVDVKVPFTPGAHGCLAGGRPTSSPLHRSSPVPTASANYISGKRQFMMPEGSAGGPGANC